MAINRFVEDRNKKTTKDKTKRGAIYKSNIINGIAVTRKQLKMFRDGPLFGL